MTRSTLKVNEKLENMLMEFVSLSGWQANTFLRNIPKEPDEGCHKGKLFISLLVMPRYSQGRDAAKYLIPIIVIMKVTVNERARWWRESESLQIVFIVQHRKDSFCSPDVNDSISNHASITAGASSSKQMSVIDEKIVEWPLENEPRFVRRKNQTGAMELFNIKSACLCSRRRMRNMDRDNK